MRKRSEAAPAMLEEEFGKTVDEALSPPEQKIEDAKNMEDPMFGPLPRARPVHAGLDRVVSKVFIEEDDFEASYDKITVLLRALETGRSEKAFWKEALQKAPEAHHLACRLVVTAKRMLSNWEADNAIRKGLMRERANRQLQAEKDDNKKAGQGGRSKVITNEDIDDRAAIVWKDDWPRYAKEERRLKLTVDNLEDCVKSLDHYNRALNSLVNSS